MKSPFLKLVSLLLCAVLILPFTLRVYADSPAPDTADAAAQFTLTLDTPSYILIEASTGRVLCEKNADQPLPPASVTKVMTLLLVMEAIDSGIIKLTDNVPVSAEAAGKGGSQIY